MSALTITHPLTLGDDRLRGRIQALLYSLAPTSQRQYAHTFKLWLAFCEANEIDPLNLSDVNVGAFLDSSDVSKTTRQARLTHLRRLAQTLYAGDTRNDHFRNCYEQLKLLRVKGHSGGQVRDKQALKPREVYALFDVWPGDGAMAVRNRALLALLFYTGLRRSEAVALTWSDLDLEEGYLTVRHGKGDKQRVVPIPGELALTYLRGWRDYIPDYVHVFVPIRKGDHIQADVPLSVDGVYRVVRASGDCAPHDARRTVLTDMLAHGTPVPDAQQFAGHAQASTTLKYAQKSDAQAVKRRIRMGY